MAECVSAFANAEGGILILGIEDGGIVTGHRYPKDAVRAILETPRHRLRPAQPAGFIIEHEGQELGFVSAVEPLALSDVEFRALLEVYRNGRIDNARLRDIAG